MQEYLKRMFSERNELLGRIKKAEKAVANPPFGSDAEGIRMLAEQIKAMKNYLFWLEERIEHEEKR